MFSGSVAELRARASPDSSIPPATDPYEVYSTASGCGEYLYDLFLCPVADKTSDNEYL